MSDVLKKAGYRHYAFPSGTIFAYIDVKAGFWKKDGSKEQISRDKELGWYIAYSRGPRLHYPTPQQALLAKKFTEDK